MEKTNLGRLEELQLELVIIFIQNFSIYPERNSMVECREIDGFQYLNKQIYSCNEKEYTVEEYLHTRTGMEFVLIPEGCFSMKDKNSCPSAHKVEVSSFLISKYVITQGVWKDVMGTEVWNLNIDVVESCSEMSKFN